MSARRKATRKPARSGGPPRAGDPSPENEPGDTIAFQPDELPQGSEKVVASSASGVTVVQIGASRWEKRARRPGSVVELVLDVTSNAPQAGRWIEAVNASAEPAISQAHT